jgi:hypothetical protein
MILLDVIHKDWEGICCIKNETLFRKNYPDEKGTFEISKNRLFIQWEKWEPEVYFQVFNKYILEELYHLHYRTIHLREDAMETIVILELHSSIFSFWNVSSTQNEYQFKNKCLKLNWTDTDSVSHQELWVEKEKNVFEKKKIQIITLFKSPHVKTEYYLDEKERTFYLSLDKNYLGYYFFQDHLIYLYWNNGKIEEYQTQEYSLSKEYKTNITYQIPCPIFIEDRVLFSDIVLSQNCLFMSSVCYFDRPWNKDAFTIQTTPPYHKCKIHEKHHFESSLLFIFEFEENHISVDVDIQYNDSYEETPLSYSEKRKVISSSIPSYTFSCMTLFKDDYPLLKKWISYYSDKGIEYFHLYYNGKITETFQKNIQELKLFEYPVTIQITEWNYEYWRYYNDGKHHHAQTMAMNHALHQLKNSSTYLLYVDLDEYIQCDSMSNVVQSHPDIDVYVFHNRFCKMGHENVSYHDFYSSYDASQIILGNYWDTMREKLLVRVDSIEVMGVHEVYADYSAKEIQHHHCGEFYHFIHFKEKYREHLMTQYVIE